MPGSRERSKIIARALKDPSKLPCRLKIGEIRLNVLLATKDVEIRERFETPLWVCLDYKGLYLFFKNTDPQYTPLLEKLFERYGFRLTDRGVNNLGFWTKFSRHISVEQGFELLRKLKEDGILSKARPDAILAMDLIAEFKR
jgi:hypothetical protein